MSWRSGGSMKILFVALALVFLVGCGKDDTVDLKGTVTLTDGTPLKAGTVHLNGAQSFRGKIEDGGVFEIKQVAKGEYKVAITDTKVGPTGLPGMDGIDSSGKYYRQDPKSLKNLIQEKYADSSKSGLTATVPGQIELKLEPASGKK
ncbi:hypothetical protein SH668x_002162 [Planctomicrobium sp. SH668]|uniref:hypothetical protein n=1 Tax=Planctomicrobium sp. SH668 TaxID=3448126 RepID=UPI003F5B4E84